MVAKKITVRLDDDLLIKLKVIVAKKSTSIQKVCHEFLVSYALENVELV